MPQDLASVIFLYQVLWYVVLFLQDRTERPQRGLPLVHNIRDGIRSSPATERFTGERPRKPRSFKGGDEWAFLSGWVGGGEASLFFSTVFSTG